MSTRAPRAVVRGLAAGRESGTLAVPLALHVSARIQERDAEDFVYDATQLANALRDLIEAVDPDGVPVSDVEVLLTTAEQMLGSEQLKAALEATRRLRSSYGDAIALVAVVPGPATIASRLGADGPAAADAVVTLGKEFLAAGTDVIIVDDVTEAPGVSLSTLANVARFHQGVALTHAVQRYGLAAATPVELEAPTTVPGVAVTSVSLARDTDIAVLSDWVSTVRG